ncbi:zinc finger protein 37 homolog isoform X20 [Nerophis ophidion]|uniref:zinc finger protein 37 homolog isoform X20 n=1 Tax=Nerophis ophidion TaxID=159077 RepID=UPI002AE05BA2|nr:zinc finger protein 37 homolog isoform X20 [Nerophis ophidion]
METAKKKAVGGNRCIAAGCSNTNRAGVSLFRFPKDDSQALLWNREVKRTRLDWTTHTKYSMLCSDHFEKSCFEEGPLLRAQMGIATPRRLVLKKGAGPTIFNIPRPGISGSVTVSAPSASASTSSDHHTPSTSGQTVPTWSVSNKRRRKVTIDQIMASTTTASVVDEPMATALDLPDEEGDQDQGSKQGCQRDWVPIGTAPTPMTSSRSTRTGKRHHRSKGQQVTSEILERVRARPARVSEVPSSSVAAPSDSPEMQPNIATPDIHQLIGHQERCLPPLQGGGFTVEHGYPQPPRVKEEEDPQPLDIKEEKEDTQNPQDIHQLIGHQEGCLPPLQGGDFTVEHGYPQQPRVKEEEDPQPLDIKEENEDTQHPQDVQQPPHIKEEEEEFWITQEEDCLLGQEEADLTKFPLTVVLVKTEDHEEKPPECSQLHHSPNVCEVHLLPGQQEWTSVVEQEEPKTPHIEEEKGRQPAHIKEEEEDSQRPCIEEGEEPQPCHFKEEEEEHSISQEGDYLEGLREFPLTVVVKSEDDEVKSESEERREAEPPSSSSTQNMTTEADGDHCGGSQADKLLAPLSDSEDTTSHSPDTDKEDSIAGKTCDTDNTHFQRSNCDKTFNHRRNLQVHTRIHTGEKTSSSSISGPGNMENNELKVHIRTHTREKPFKCSICSKTFSQKQHLKVHTKVHTGEKPFTCTICGKGFIQNNGLKVHMIKHTGEKPFSCSICHKGFIQSSDLKVHTRIHTGEKPSSCSICGQRFTKGSELNVHMRTHTGEKPFMCSVCSKSFSQKQHLKIHARIHTGEKPFSCSVCGKGFNQRQHLKLHARIHTGEKPFSCSVCGKGFIQNEHLKIHMRRHTGEKVLSCSVCDERFSYKYQCQKHKCAGETSSSK